MQLKFEKLKTFSHFYLPFAFMKRTSIPLISKFSDTLSKFGTFS
jgi:hypothetical protein